MNSWLLEVKRKRKRKKLVEKNKEKTDIDDNIHYWYQQEFHKNSFYDSVIILISTE